MVGDDSVTPEEIFAALGNELRVSILRVLAAAQEADAETTSFTDIYDRIDIDSTSQFAYHLAKLEDVFVRKTDGEYVLTQAGDRLVRAIRSGIYTDRPSFDRTVLDGHCPACESTTLAAEFHDPFLTVDCTECGKTIVTYDLPPAEARDRTAMEILYACDQRVHHEYAMALQGICPLCSGTMNVEVQRRSEHDDVRYSVATCDCCHNQVFAPVEVRLIYHPSVISLYWIHGIDTTTIPFWEIRTYFEEWETEIRGTDPFECQITVRVQGDERRVLLDDSLQVTVLDEEPPLSAE